MNPVVAGGDSLVAHRGVVGPGFVLWPEYQDRPSISVTPVTPAMLPSVHRFATWHRLGEWRDAPASRHRHDPRCPGLVPVQGRPGPGPLRRQGEEPPESP